ncbi:amidohydrolase 2 [Polychaeton citri CBS 116435]|uniref:6-methylsalicylate decarboxylase n=1 Tax=Polychaeton citri CBS 116435 TaxID=1314669 RepID=A0A9P4UUK7_9PEZI|nr:amidohydrolase 2 [Polychaeton citri CBS 116435]
MPHRIDVHVHYLPPAYRKACVENGHANPDGMPYLPEWDEESHLALMDKLNISKSILSVSSPGTHLVYGDSALAAKVTRECNAYGADLKKRMPDRFGYFASLPIPDVALCLQEIKQSAEEGCDGFVFLSNGHGFYPGDTMFDPIFEELDRRHATVFFHPTTPCVACTNPKAAAIGANTEGKPTQATPFADKFPNPMLEFMFETSRLLTNLFLSGTVRRSPNVKIILPHLGGTFPPIFSRWTGFSTLVPGPWEGVSEDEARATLKKQFWFDLAGFPFPGQIKGLTEGVGVGTDRIMYGSDYPFTKAPGVEMLAEKMDEGMKGAFCDEEIEGMYFRNAEKLFS